MLTLVRRPSMALTRCWVLKMTLLQHTVSVGLTGASLLVVMLVATCKVLRPLLIEGTRCDLVMAPMTSCLYLVVWARCVSL